MGTEAVETTPALAVEITFTLPVDAAVWAGADGDDMTTKEVADEVRHMIEQLAITKGAQEGWLVKHDSCGAFHANDACPEERW